ncbi:hypothetical protein LXT21_11080 [Myxococcus sp. K38C18041901]|uniref:hypothetical protein n=1 Tax=Myxococcus guangdongensis TaxID=2906760 RepID=UPI0020A767DC|nr:hypothetical protein [Myxococcus guangdongensis]MCP3059316.1 hypothetical protein [Myxococcus guangdongensis]
MCKSETAAREGHSPEGVLRILEARRLDALDCALVIEVAGRHHELRAERVGQSPSFGMSVGDFSPSQRFRELRLSAHQVQQLVRAAVLVHRGEPLSLPVEFSGEPSPV